MAKETLRELYVDTAGCPRRAARWSLSCCCRRTKQPLDARTAALAQWCQGFLYGLGTSVVQDESGLPGDIGEIVRDLTEITHVAVDTEQTRRIERERLRRAGRIRAGRRAAGVR